MRASDYVKSGNFVKKEDLQQDGEREYTIQDVDVDVDVDVAVDVAEFGDASKGTTERRLQLVLDDDARFTLNATNTRILIKHYMDDTARWMGLPVILAFDESIQYAGRMVGGIRVKVPKRGPSG